MVVSFHFKHIPQRNFHLFDGPQRQKLSGGKHFTPVKATPFFQVIALNILSIGVNQVAL
jgi:hypothetical protein